MDSLQKLRESLREECDRLAFHEFFQPHADRIAAWLRGEGDRHGFDGEALVAEVFERGWRSCRNRDITQWSVAWLNTIATNLLIDRIRSTRRTGPQQSLDDLVADGGSPILPEGVRLADLLEDTAPGPETAVVERAHEEERRRGIKSEVRKLTLLQQRIVELHYREGMTLIEVARVLGKSRVWISKQHGKALRELGIRLSSLLQEDEAVT